MREKRRLRDRGDAALNAPPQSDLGRRLAVGGSDLFEQRMAQQRAAAERTPGLNLNALGTAEIDGGRLRIARMNFELIHHRFYAGTGKQRNEVMGKEVGYADGTNAPFGVKLFERTPGAGVLCLPDHGLSLSGRPMDEEQIEIVRLHLGEDHLIGFAGALIGAV